MKISQNKNVTTIVTDNYAKIVLEDTGVSQKITIGGYYFNASDLRFLASILQDRADALAPPVKSNLTPQDRKVVGHLNRRGSISALEALDGYRIRRLAASIYRLKQNGWKFKVVTKYDASGQRYARYYTKETPAANLSRAA